MSHKSVIAAMFLVASMSAVAAAQNNDPFQTTEDDRIQMQQCQEAVRDIRASGKKASLRDCIGRVSDLCLEIPENQTTQGMVACVMREQQWWDGQLNFFYGALRQTLSPEAKTGLRDIQRAWIKYKDLKCGFAHVFFEGGTMAQPIGAGCLLRTTAERTIELSSWLEMRN